MPGVYRDGELDIAGTCVGVVERDRLIDGSRVEPGDVVLGLPSSGFHCNGYTLVRRLLGDDPFDADLFLAPTRLYVDEVARLRRDCDVRALANVTGGGIPGNLARVLPRGPPSGDRPRELGTTGGVPLARRAGSAGGGAATRLQPRHRLLRGRARGRHGRQRPSPRSGGSSAAPAASSSRTRDRRPRLRLGHEPPGADRRRPPRSRASRATCPARTRSSGRSGPGSPWPCSSCADFETREAAGPRDGGLARRAGRRDSSSAPATCTSSRAAFLARFPGPSSTSTPPCSRPSPARTPSTTRSRRAWPRPGSRFTSSTRASTRARCSLQERVPVLAGRYRGDAARAPARRRASAPAGRDSKPAREAFTVARVIRAQSSRSGTRPVSTTLARGLADLGVELIASGGTSARLAELGLAHTRVDERDRVPGAPRRTGQDAASADPRGHPRPAQTCTDDHGCSGRARDRADRPRLRQPVPVRRGRLAQGHTRGGGRRDDRRRRPHPASRRGQELHARRAGLLPDPVRARARRSCGRQATLSASTRRKLAAATFAYTAAYEASIAAWFADREAFPARFVVALEKRLDLPYGENPHQRAAYYSEAGASRHLLSRVEQLSGRELSFNNLNDLWAARSLLGGVLAAGLRDRQAREPVRVRARRLDRGRVREGARMRSGVGLRRHRRAQPDGRGGARPPARRPVRRGPDRAGLHGGGTRHLSARSRRPGSSRAASTGSRRPGSADYRRVLGGFLVQDADLEMDERDGMEVVTGAHPCEDSWGDLLLAWRVARHVASNAIVIAKDLATIGIGGGQTSRVDAVRIARRQGARARPRPDGGRARLGCVLPLRRRCRARPRRGRDGDRPARRLQA